MISLRKILKSKGYCEHNLSIAKKSGHIITKVMVNGHTGRFIIDTGASATCIDQALYKEYELETEFLDRTIGTASGSLRPRISYQNHLEVGEWSDEDTALLTMDMTFINNALKKEKMRSIQGLLGADFLISSKAIIDYRSKKLFLKL